MSTEFINDQWRLPNAWNGTESNVNKQSNYSMDYDATNQSVIVSSNNVFNFRTGDFTLSAWIKVDSFGSSYYPYILDFRSSGTANENAVAIYLDPNGILQVWISNSLKIGSSGTALVANTWYNVILKRESGTLSTHINGGSADQTASYAGDMNTTPPLTIGARAGNTQAINGQIDGVSIFNYALSQSQITTLYGSSSTGIGNPMSLSPKPVAYYPLGDQDAFNGASYLTPNSSLKDFVFDFDGSNDYIDYGNVDALKLGAGDFTWSGWINPDSWTSNFEALYTCLASNGVWIGIDGTNFVLRIVNGSNIIAYSTLPTVNTWTHISITRVSGACTLYYNGVSVATATSTHNFNVNGNVNLGGYGTYGNFNGKISNVQVFNTALSSTEIETLYNYGSPIRTLANIPQSSNLQGWWKLDASATYDSSTTTWSIPDDSTNSNTGTSSGMTQANLVQSDLSFTSGYSPYALDFDRGSSDSIDVNMDLSSFSSITVSTWAKFNSTTGYQYVYSAGTGSVAGDILAIGKWTSSTEIYSFDRVNANRTGVSVTLNTWNHILVTHTGTTRKVYLNGSLIGTFTSGNLNLNSINFIGRYSFSASNYMDGSISNVSTWNTALTSAQVTEIYNEGVPSNLNNHSAYSNLVSWWQLGSNSSFNTNWTVLDEKGSNNGTSVNMGEDAIVDGVGSYANGVSSGKCRTLTMAATRGLFGCSIC